MAKKKLHQLIIEDNLKQAIEQLLIISKNTTNNNLQQEIIAQAAKLEDYNKNQRLGLKTIEEQNITISRIRSALLEIIDKLPDNEVNLTNHTFSKKRLWQLIIGIEVIIIIIVGLRELAGVSILDLFSSSAIETFDVTVFVHGIGGKHQRILEDEGKVVLDLRSDRKEGAINEKGETTFKELPVGFINKQVLITIDHPQPYQSTHPDSLYKLQKNGVIYLEVNLQKTEQIFGEIADFRTNIPLDSVRVSIRDLEAFTNENGEFTLYIPLKYRQKFQRVTFYKKGYIRESLNEVPVHQQKPILLKLKKQNK